MHVLEELIKLALMPLEAITRFLAVGPGLVLSLATLGGLAFWWRHYLLRQKKVEAALGVLEALDRLREDYHSARQQDTAMAATTQARPRSAANRREEQMTKLRDEYQRGLAKLDSSRDALKAAQAKAVALFGHEAQEPLKVVYRLVDVLVMQSGYYWPKAIHHGKVMDAGRGDPHKMEATFPQPGMFYGHPGDEVGRQLGEAIATAERWYEPRAARNRQPRRGQG